jgi:hypothetical protein
MLSPFGLGFGRVAGAGATGARLAAARFESLTPRRPLRELDRLSVTLIPRRSHPVFPGYCCKSRKLHQSEIFGETLKCEPVDDSDNLSRATEVAYEFCVRR